jgi:hypothetical protein
MREHLGPFRIRMGSCRIFRSPAVAAFHLTFEFNQWIDRDVAECGLDGHFVFGHVMLDDLWKNGSEIAYGPKGGAYLRRPSASECASSGQADEWRLQTLITW